MSANASEQVGTLRIERRGGAIALVTLSRPERLNALTMEMFEDLHVLAARAAADESLRCIVLTGEGRGFCAGLDFDLVSSMRDFPVATLYSLQARGAAAIAAIRTMPIPMIAAVNGPAAGGGLALALAADIRIAARDAVFTTAFVKLGLSGCDVGVSWLLPRIVGFGYASELMLTGRRISAEEAARVGLVNRVVNNEDLLDAAFKTAESIACHNPFGVSLTKEGLQLAADAPSLQAAIALENRTQVLAAQTVDMRQAVERVGVAEESG